MIIFVVIRAKYFWMRYTHKMKLHGCITGELFLEQAGWLTDARVFFEPHLQVLGGVFFEGGELS